MNEMSVKQTNYGIVVTKWHNNLDVRMLSTKMLVLKGTPRRDVSIVKPECISKYNYGKSSIDLRSKR